MKSLAKEDNPATSLKVQIEIASAISIGAILACLTIWASVGLGIFLAELDTTPLDVVGKIFSLIANEIWK